jgi:hypothetical protein
MTDKTKEALKMALEALESCYLSDTSMYMSFHKPKVDIAITAIREALAEESSGTEQPAIKQDLTPEQHQCKFPMCQNEEYQQALAEQIKRELYTGEPAQRKPLTDEMVVAAARVLSDRQAAACNVDCGDMWKIHGNDFIEDARAALEAAHGIKGDA